MKVSVYIPYNCCKSSIIDKSTEAYNVNIISKCIKREERDISDRSHWLYNAAIWCRNHEVRVHILGAGKRPKMLPKKWFWYDMENDHWSQKHILAWKNGIVDTDADYSVFTDSDISLDVDTMVEDLNKTNLVSKEPLYWGGGHGEEMEHWFNRFGLNTERELNIKYKIEKPCASYVVAVINKNATNKILSNKKAINSLYTECKNKFIDSDVSVPYLVYANGIKSIQAQGCENRNFFLIFSKLVNRGKLWHIHFCLTSPLVDTRKLASLLKDGPHDSIELCIDKSIKGLSRNKIRVKDYINRKFDLGYFFCPWVHLPFPFKSDGVLEILSKSTCKLTYNTGIILNGSIQEIDNGFIISFTDRTITCKWTYKMEDGTILLVYYETFLPNHFHSWNSAIQAMFPK